MATGHLKLSFVKGWVALHWFADRDQAGRGQGMRSDHMLLLIDCCCVFSLLKSSLYRLVNVFAMIMLPGRVGGRACSKAPQQVGKRGCWCYSFDIVWLLKLHARMCTTGQSEAWPSLVQCSVARGQQIKLLLVHWCSDSTFCCAGCAGNLEDSTAIVFRQGMGLENHCMSGLPTMSDPK